MNISVVCRNVHCYDWVGYINIAKLQKNQKRFKPQIIIGKNYLVLLMYFQGNGFGNYFNILISKFPITSILDNVIL